MGGGVEYIVIATEQHYQEILRYGVEDLNIPREIFLKGSIFTIPYFDWKRYIKIYKGKISIVAECCYGGILSHCLGLPFYSPFVNLRVNDRDSYTEMICNLNYYMSVSPTTKNIGRYKDKDWTSIEGRVKYPILWYGDIMLHGFHYRSEEDFYKKWEERRKRYHSESTVVFKILYDEKDIEEFEALNLQNKVGVYYENTKWENIITTPVRNVSVYDYAYQYGSYVTQTFITGTVFRYIDIFKALLGEEDFKK